MICNELMYMAASGSANLHLGHLLRDSTQSRIDETLLSIGEQAPVILKKFPPEWFQLPHTRLTRLSRTAR